jgi:hypothetical protein
MKQCCHEFAERQGWNTIREFSEKCVSSYYGYAWNAGPDIAMTLLPCGRPNYIACMPLIVKGKRRNGPTTRHRAENGAAAPW